MAYSKTNWQNLPSTTSPVIASNLNKIENELEKLDNASGFDAYDNTATYNVDDFCIYNNILYKAITNIGVAENFTPAHWVATNVIEEIQNLHNFYSNQEVRIGKWIDGKPLYRKAVNVDALKNAGTTKIFLGSDEVVKNFDIYVSNGQYRYKLPWARKQSNQCFL